MPAPIPRLKPPVNGQHIDNRFQFVPGNNNKKSIVFSKLNAGYDAAYFKALWQKTFCAFFVRQTCLISSSIARETKRDKPKVVLPPSLSVSFVWVFFSGVSLKFNIQLLFVCQ